MRYYDNCKKNTTYWEKFDCFTKSLHLVLDFLEKNEPRRKLQEQLWGCKTVEKDRFFYIGQLQDPPTCFCSDFVDRKWQKTEKRKASHLERSRDEQANFSSSFDFGDVIDKFIPSFDETVPDNVPSDPSYQCLDSETPKKKSKYEKEKTSIHNDDMPPKYQHIRQGLRSVRPEVYALKF